MSERFWITGVQLGNLIALPGFDERKAIVDDIEEKQFIGDREDLKKMLDVPSTLSEVPWVGCRTCPGLHKTEDCPNKNIQDTKKEYTKEELDEWRRRSDNFISSDEDRDKLFKELGKYWKDTQCEHDWEIYCGGGDVACLEKDCNHKGRLCRKCKVDKLDVQDTQDEPSDFDKGYEEGQEEYRQKLKEHFNGMTEDHEEDCFICELKKNAEDRLYAPGGKK